MALVSSIGTFLITSKVYLRKAGHAYGMTKKGHVFINLEKFKDKTPKTGCKFKVFRVTKY